MRSLLGGLLLLSAASSSCAWAFDPAATPRFSARQAACQRMPPAPLRLQMKVCALVHPARCFTKLTRTRGRGQDTWKRIGNIAKDKLGGGKDWIDKGADADKDVNVRGAATGAVVGALVAGPFGALVGGWLGKGSGLSKAAEDKELERLGMTRETAQLMQQLLSDFQESEAALQDVSNSCKEFENRVTRLKRDVAAAFDAAKDKLQSGDEEAARRHLTDKVNYEEQLKKAEELFADMDSRRQQLKLGVTQLEERLLEVQATATRGRAANAMLKSFDPLEGGATDGTIRDPLLEKFDKWEREDKR